MTRAFRIGVGGALALAVIASTGVLTRYEYVAEPEEAAALRLAWRARVPLVAECRRLTPEEQAELPIHMRREEVCEGEVASYRLEVMVDGDIRHRATVAGAGARGDRPLYVFETVPLTPGRHDVRIVFARIGGDRVEGPVAGVEGEQGGEDGEDVVGGAHARRGAETVPDRLVLDQSVEVSSREIALVTYDATRRELVVR